MEEDLSEAVNCHSRQDSDLTDVEADEAEPDIPALIDWIFQCCRFPF